MGKIAGGCGCHTDQQEHPLFSRGALSSGREYV